MENGREILKKGIDRMRRRSIGRILTLYDQGMTGDEFKKEVKNTLWQADRELKGLVDIVFGDREEVEGDGTES